MAFQIHGATSLRVGATMKVVGVGGGGGNAVDRMIAEGLSGVEFIALNTDAKALGRCRAETRIQIGRQLTRGLGAGARPEIGRQACEESCADVVRVLDGADLVFVTCGMGGGTGTGAAPLVADIARQAGALTIGIVTRPFLFEGRRRRDQASEGIEALRQCTDTLIVVQNELLVAVAGRSMGFVEALAKADEVLLHATRGISSLVTVAGVVNVDFADLRTVMRCGGAGLIGMGSASGAGRAAAAARQAVTSPLLDDVSIAGAGAVLVNIMGGADLTLGEVHEINDTITQFVNEEAEIIFGAVHDPSLRDELRVTVIATGMSQRPVPAAPPVTLPTRRNSPGVRDRLAAWQHEQGIRGAQRALVAGPVAHGQEQPGRPPGSHAELFESGSHLAARRAPAPTIR